MAGDRKSREEIEKKTKKSSSSSRKRSVSPASSASEDEGRSRKRSRKEEDKKKKKKKDKPKDSKSRSADKEKQSKDKHKAKHQKGDGKPRSNIQELSADDYFAKNNEFATWLKEKKKVFFSDLSAESAREYFTRFVKAWNNQKLDSRYYDGISSGPRTAHNWQIRE